ncbi:MAG: DUF1611 domain-containing protein [Betaproteobacteria bacterium]|jgi:uncharacterized NAD-dependent epimerase/dehydratase family protein|nr:DUF1611 domain-containing protein [Rubrivivax sp.]
MHQLRKPYLVFLGDVSLRSDAKTGFGLRDWCPADVLGECALPSASVSLDLPTMTPAEAAARGAGSIVIGVAPPGGRLPEAWIPTLVDALHAGLDVVSGMHTRLERYPELVAAARECQVRLINVRHADRDWPVGTGRRRTGKRLLTVGTDCALGKKYTALAITRALTSRGVKATFRATGQTGILIAGEGVAIDAVVSDFVAGAAEALSPANDADHWDVIEGQGALFHPAYAGVTLGLLHGSQPDAIVLCHDPSRQTIEDHPHMPLPPLDEAIRRYLEAGRLTNAGIRCVGVAINSSTLSDTGWMRYRDGLQGRLGLPVCDPMRGGVEPIAEALLA